jgi:uncharacterized phage infection (PIP) family protein YhgE
MGVRERTPKSLEELRVRLGLKSPSEPPAPPAAQAPNGAAQPTAKADAIAAPSTSTPQPVSAPTPTQSAAQNVKGANAMSQEQSQVANSVAKLFEPTRTFEDRLTKLVPAFDQAERLAKEALGAFGSVGELTSKLEKFLESFAQMKAFQDQVAALAQGFEPMQPVQNHLSEMSRALGDHLKGLSGLLERAKSFQRRVSELSQALEPATALQERLEKLAASADATAHAAAAPAAPVNGAAQQAR